MEAERCRWAGCVQPMALVLKMRVWDTQGQRFDVQTGLGLCATHAACSGRRELAPVLDQARPQLAKMGCWSVEKMLADWTPVADPEAQRMLAKQAARRLEPGRNWES